MSQQSDIRNKALDIYKHIREAHHQSFIEMGKLKGMVANCSDLGAAVDAIAVLKRAEELLRSAKKEVAESISALSKVTCMRYVASPNFGDSIRTEWVTATPDSKSVPSLPKYSDNPVAFKQLAEHFGVPESAFALWRPHWPDLKEYISKCEEEMKPIPPGIDKHGLKTEYIVICRWQKDIEPDVLV